MQEGTARMKNVNKICRLLFFILIGLGLYSKGNPFFLSAVAQSTALPLDVQIDLSVVELERAIVNEDHTTVLERVARIRDLDPSADSRSDLLYFEAEAALALKNLDRAEAALTTFLSLRGRASQKYDDALALMAGISDARRGRGPGGTRVQGEVVIQDWAASIYDQETEPEHRYCSASPRFDPRASLMVSRGSGWMTHSVLLSNYHQELDGYRLRIDGPGGRLGIAVYGIGPTSFMEDGLGWISFDTLQDAAAFYDLLDLGEAATILTPDGAALGSFSLRGAAEAIQMVRACDL